MGSSEQVFPWLRTLPLAPEYHPTLSEFQDPISYIFKIEKEASKYGICKIVPPLPPQPKKTSIANFKLSLSAKRKSENVSDGVEDRLPTFTTRQQQIGFCPRKNKPVQKPVWQSGETYTFHEFESKARNFEKVYMKKCGKFKGLKGLSALEMETLFWKASLDKPFSVEYANDMPGSAFVPLENVKRVEEAGEAVNVGETGWNMRGVSRAKGSLLRFMKEEIPGVTSPMVYLAMMFSWFAWHVEDHDLHSLNYLHMGAGKTWYGVPREGAAAFEEVVRVQGYEGEINPLAMFSTLGEKTTVMSPEVFVRAGVPCCRLVQNPGEFVVTFPRAYHSGFSHGFNCGEAANIATPEWLKVANEAAIRRASINYPPMVSHFQLLYDLVLELCSSVPISINQNPRSSRLKDKKKGEGETLVKELFVQDVIQNNHMLHILGRGTSIVLLPQNSSDFSISPKLRGGSQPQLQSSFSRGLLSHGEAITTSSASISRDFVLGRNYSSKQYTPTSRTWNESTDKNIVDHNDALSDQRLFSCVTCGILCFSCVAIIQPSEAAGKYLRSTDSGSFSDWDIGSGSLSLGFIGSRNVNTLNMNFSGRGRKSTPHGLYDVPIQSTDDQIQVDDQNDEIISDSEVKPAANALGLLALNYGNSSDSEEGQHETDSVVYANEANFSKISSDLEFESDSSGSSNKQECHYDADEGHSLFPTGVQYEDGLCKQSTNSYTVNASERDVRYSSSGTFKSSISAETDDPSMESNRSGKFFKNSIIKPASINAVVPTGSTSASIASRSDEDASRMHVFCLKHAVEVEQKLLKIGGVRLLLLCHPDYPRVEAEAKIIAAELGLEHFWNVTPFRNASKEDTECIQTALDSEEAIPGNGDWAVKMGINLFYTAILSRSPLYSKQMPYNSIIYDAFGRFHTDDSSELNISKKGAHRQKKIVLAGKWCGKVWMSNQVHPLLVPRDQELEHEEKSFPARGTLDEMPGVKSEASAKKEIITYTRKLKRRTMGVDNTSTMKAKSAGHDDLVDGSDGLLEDNFQRESRRIVKSKYMRKETVKHSKQVAAPPQKKARLLNLHLDDEKEAGPSTRLRRRDPRSQKVPEAKPVVKKQSSERKPKKSAIVKTSRVRVKEEDGAKPKKAQGNEEVYQCNMEGCTMTFCSKQELGLHKRNVCPVKGCGKNFFSHKYLLQHRRVHLDDRPLKCPWKGCKMSFKWAWARTEHIRVHTGARPYVCAEAGCGQTFRFVSDFSRHKRKTGHLTRKSMG